jgi:hypothetical protein
MLGSTLQDLPSDSPAACRSACRRRRASPRTGSHQRTILACTRPILVGHAVELATAHLPRRRPGPHRRLGWPSTACASFEHEAPTQADHEPGMDAAGDHADPGHPAVRLPAPPPRSRTSLRPDTADAATHRHRTPTPDAGQRTPGRSDAHTGHWTPVPWTSKRGHWSLALDTGHWTPDAGRGRGQGDEGAAGIRTSWATTPSDRTLGRPTDPERSRVFYRDTLGLAIYREFGSGPGRGTVFFLGGGPRGRAASPGHGVVAAGA